MLRRSQLRRVVDELRSEGVLQAADLHAEDLDRVLHHLAEEGRGRWTMKSMRDGVAGFCRWLSKKGKVLRNPGTDLILPEGREEELTPPPLSLEQVNALLDSVPRSDVHGLRNAACIQLLYDCGLRRAEAMDLDVGDVDKRKRMLHIREGKGGVERRLPVQAGTLAAIQDYLVLRRTLLQGPDHGALFLSERGTRLSGSTFGRWFLGHALRTLGPKVKAHPHLLRHSIAVHLLRNGVNIRYLSEFLGHANINTTKIYLRLIPEHLREDYDRAMPVLG